jgi:hypothetical protein
LGLLQATGGHATSEANYTRTKYIKHHSQNKLDLKVRDDGSLTKVFTFSALYIVPFCMWHFEMLVLTPADVLCCVVYIACLVSGLRD